MSFHYGFFASKTFGLDLEPLKAKDNYGMRDEQKKVFGIFIQENNAR